MMPFMLSAFMMSCVPPLDVGGAGDATMRRHLTQWAVEPGHTLQNPTPMPACCCPFTPQGSRSASYPGADRTDPWCPWSPCCGTPDLPHSGGLSKDPGNNLDVWVQTCVNRCRGGPGG
mmetsp:Transcript_10142/g.22888  ORF Transcript_10142/g.22888 Transcript_10142/m.22888 type:complete len:118 (+) Transcript_10142:294-647(+)